MPLASFLIMIISITVTTACTIMTIPVIIMIETDEANGLNRIITPTTKSIMPKISSKTQFGMAFLATIATLIISTLDKMIQMPSAIAKMVDKMFGIASKIRPIIMDNMPDMTPKNGV